MDYLIKVGADSKTRDAIFKKLNKLLDTAQIRYNETMDFVEPMRKLEYQVKRNYDEFMPLYLEQNE